MARSRNVWGIDIGKCGLKALRCSRSSDSEKLVVDAFDYIEYPMLLTQPEADPGELVRDAVEEFLSRNDVVGDTLGHAEGLKQNLRLLLSYIVDGEEDG